LIALGTIDRASDTSAFKQIADQLRDAIRTGELAPGDRLPSESELMSHYAVARMTARQSLAELRAEGIVIAERGRGVFVQSRPPVRRLAADRFARRHRDRGLAAFSAETEGLGVARVDQLEVSREKPDLRLRSLLDLDGRARVVARRRRYLLDEQPVELAESYVPLDIAQGTKIEQLDSGPGGIYARIEELGHTLREFVEEVSARMPTPEERQRLMLMQGVPVIVVTRRAIDAAGRVVEVTDTVKAASRYVLEYSFPAK
jgi:GntR family transcriptional regulator